MDKQFEMPFMKKGEISDVVDSSGNAKYLHIGRDKIGKLSRDAKEDTYYGLHNLDIPYEMAVAMNPFELIGAYYAAGYIKKNDSASIRKGKVTFEELKQKPAEEVISILNQIFFYNEPRGFRIKKHFREQHTTKPGDLIKRIKALDPVVKERFMESFGQPRKCSYRETGLERGYFGEPESVGGYVNCISILLKERYEK